MVGAQFLRAFAVVGAIVLSGSLASCSSTGCLSGADSAPEAVIRFLHAAPDATKEADICQWVPKGGGAEGLKLAQALSQSLRATDVDSLVIEESPSEQEGAVHVVTVAGGDLPVTTFLVLDEDGRYVVAPEASMEAASSQ